MPKGVEHRYGDCFGNIAIGVESLMPKGVEHYYQGIASLFIATCRISDAERR